jgi:hypothetical protein
VTKFAQKTTVSPEKSRGEIEALLSRYGADSFGYAWEESGRVAVIQFCAKDRMVRFKITMPDPKDRRFTHTTHKNRRSQTVRSFGAQLIAWEQAKRQRWRALALVVKAKLEAVDAGITTFEQEFLAHILLPNGQTTAQWMGPQLAAAYASGVMPRSMLALPEHSDDDTIDAEVSR